MNVCVIEIDKDIYSNNKFWNILFSSIYNSYKIEYIINKNKKYMNCSNTYYKANTLRTKFENNGIKICHKDYKCNSYLREECSCESKLNKKNIKTNEITYIFEGAFKLDKNKFENIWNKNDNEFNNEDKEFNNDDKEFNNDDDDDEFKKEYKKFTNKIKIKELLLLIEKKNKQYTISNIKFVLDKKVQIINELGINDDHRGSDHMIIKLPFEQNIKLSNEFTLEEFIIASINLKSHKFDYWYELYCGTNYKINDSGDEIYINLDFDHGS